MRVRAINQGFSIAPVVFGTSRIVDRTASPAFQLLENVIGNFREDNFLSLSFIHKVGHGSELVTTLEKSLRDLFDAGLSSPAD